jgi:hypothetical protein
MDKVIWFIKDYISRHKHPVDAILHIIGVPQVFFGIYQLCTGEWRWGIFNFVVGYSLQIIGHLVFEKNEVGEAILIKHLITKIFKKTSK